MINANSAIAIAFVTALAVGIAMVAWGVRGRVLSRLPHCRRCKFDVSASNHVFDRDRRRVDSGPDRAGSPKCPECGSDLSKPRSVVFVLRRARWVPLIAGIVLVTVPLTGVLSPRLRSKALAAAAHHSSDMVVVRLGESQISPAFSNELALRVRSGTLSAPAMRECASKVLQRAQSFAFANPYQSPWLFWDLAKRGAFTSEEVLSVVGEPRITYDMPSRVREQTPSRLFVRVDFPNWRAPGELSIVLENAPKDGSDYSGVLKARRLMFMGHGLFQFDDQGISAEHVVELDPPPSMVESFVQMPQRDVRVRADVVLMCGRSEVARVCGVRFDRQQEVIEAGQPLIDVDMDPSLNEAARAAFAGMTLTRSGNNPAGMAQIEFRWTRESPRSNLYYKIVARPAGDRGALPVFTLQMPPRSHNCRGGDCVTTVTTTRTEADLPQACDLQFVPDPRGAEEAFRRDARYSSIPGDSFVIDNVPVQQAK